MSRRALLWFCALGAGVPVLVLGAPGPASADTLPPLTLPPATLPPLVQTPPTVSLSPGDGLQVQLPPLSPDTGDGFGVGLPGFSPITTPVTLPATSPSGPTGPASAPVATPPGPAGPAPTSHIGSDRPGADASSPSVALPGAPHFEAAHIDSTSARVVGAIDDHHRGGFWSTIGSAAVTYWFWFVLCAIALGVRLVAVAAWRDRMRATD